MTPQFIVGALLLTAMVAALGAGARAARRVLMPETAGSTAWVVDGVLGLGALVIVAEALGTVGAFRRWPLAITTVAIGTLGWAVLRDRATTRAAPDAGTRQRSRWALVLGLGGCAAVAGQWGAWTASPLRNGIYDYDSLNYHLTFAARFVQSGSTTGLHQTSPDVPIHLYPGNSELLHAVGMVLVRSDVLSVFLNVGWLAFALLCGWAAGRRLGVGPAAALAVACVMATPVMATTQAGSAVNDAAALAPFLAGVALLVDAPALGGSALVGGMAAGLAIGTKVTLIGPCLALALAVVWRSGRGTRRTTAAAWAGGAILTGGYWYVRNLLSTGSLMPSTNLSILGLPHTHFLLVGDLGYSVAHYWDRPHLWWSVFVPGLSIFGDAWPVVLVAAAVAGVVGLLKGSGALRCVAFVTLISAIAYAVTPTTAVGFNGRPLLYAVNLRYLTPALAAGLIAVVLTVAGRLPRRELATVPMAALLVVTLLPGAHAPWPSVYPALAIALALTATAVLLAGAVLGYLGPVARRPALLGAACLAVAGGAVVNHIGSRHQYTYDKLDTWVRRHIHHSRIAIAGFNQQYALYGPGWTNYVQYVGTVLPHGGFTTARSCRAWRAGLRGGHFSYVVVRDELAVIEYPHGVPELAWTESDPVAHVVFTGDGGTVLRLDGAPDPGSCPATSPAPAV